MSKITRQAVKEVCEFIRNNPDEMQSDHYHFSNGPVEYPNKPSIKIWVSNGVWHVEFKTLPLENLKLNIWQKIKIWREFRRWKKLEQTADKKRKEQAVAKVLAQLKEVSK